MFESSIWGIDQPLPEGKQVQRKLGQLIFDPALASLEDRETETQLAK